MNNGPTISSGSTGRYVKETSTSLSHDQWGSRPSNITGTFDSTTEQAVKDFQQGANLPVDGIVGPKTWQASSGGSKYAGVRSWCLGQRCDRVTKRPQEIFNSCD